MVLSTGSYLVCDTLMKVVAADLPPYQVLTMRGIAALLWGLPLLFLLGHGAKAPLMFEPRVLMRNLFETAAILCYIVALTNMPIADATALMQIIPLLVLLGASFLYGERIGGLRMTLIGLGFAGAILVAQPTGAGISVYALLALASSVMGAARDLVGRRVPGHVPGMVVAMSAALVVLVFALAAHVAVEDWIAPTTRHILLMAGSGFFLIFGHFFIFMAYRVGPTGLVAPFFYSFTVWAVISGVVVFGHVPNLMAASGIVLIIASGLAVVLLDERRRRPAPVG